MKKQAQKTKKVKKPMSRRAKVILISSVAAVLILATVLTTVLLLIPKEPALTYEGVTISREMYAYWYSVDKYEAMHDLGIYGYQDNAAFWNSESDIPGKTWGQVLDEAITRSIKQRLVAAVMYDQLGRSMTKAQREKVKGYYDELVGRVAGGSEEKMAEILAKYGTSKSAIKKCAAIDMKAELYYNYLATGNATAMTVDELNRACRDSYVRFHVLAIYEDHRLEKQEDGTYAEVELTPLDDPAGIVNELETYLPGNANDGKMTDELFLEMLDQKSYDVFHEVYPLGFFLCRRNAIPMLPEKVLEEAWKLSPGDLSCCEVTDEDGKTSTYYVRAYDMGIAPYNDESTRDFFFMDEESNFYFLAAKQVIAERTLAEIDKVEVHTENVAGFSVTNVPRNFEIAPCSMKS